MAAILFLFLSTSTLLLAQTLAADPQHCTTTAFGSLQGLPLKLPLVKLKPGVWEWELNIPTDVCPDETRAVGSLVRACDPDGPPPPGLRLDALGWGRVFRRSSAAHAAVARCLVFCAYPARAGLSSSASSSANASSNASASSNVSVGSGGGVSASSSAIVSARRSAAVVRPEALARPLV